MLLLNDNIFYYGSSSMFTLFFPLIINLFKTLSLMFLNTLKRQYFKIIDIFVLLKECL